MWKNWQILCSPTCHLSFFRCSRSFMLLLWWAWMWLAHHQWIYLSSFSYYSLLHSYVPFFFSSSQTDPPIHTQPILILWTPPSTCFVILSLSGFCSTSSVSLFHHPNTFLSHPPLSPFLLSLPVLPFVCSPFILTLYIPHTHHSHITNHQRCGVKCGNEVHATGGRSYSILCPSIHHSVRHGLSSLPRLIDHRAHITEATLCEMGPRMF